MTERPQFEESHDEAEESIPTGTSKDAGTSDEVASMSDDIAASDAGPPHLHRGRGLRQDGKEVLWRNPEFDEEISSIEHVDESETSECTGSGINAAEFTQKWAPIWKSWTRIMTPQMQKCVEEATKVEVTSEDDGRPIDAVDRDKRSLSARKVGGRRLRLARGVTVDSGAHDNVMPRRLLRGRKVRPSAASRMGVHYVCAGDTRIANEGEAELEFQSKEGHSLNWTFQIAEVNKALASVASLVDSGHKVTFDQDDRTGEDISFITNKRTGQQIKMRRDRNVWLVDAYIEDDGNGEKPNPTEDFVRRG